MHVFLCLAGTFALSRLWAVIVSLSPCLLHFNSSRQTEVCKRGRGGGGGGGGGFVIECVEEEKNGTRKKEIFIYVSNGE